MFGRAGAVKPFTVTARSQCESHCRTNTEGSCAPAMLAMRRSNKATPAPTRPNSVRTELGSLHDRGPGRAPPLDIRSHPDSVLAGALGAALWGGFRVRKLARKGQAWTLRRESLDPERHHRVDARGSSGRQHGSQKADAGEEEGGRGQSERIERSHFVEKRR